MSRDTALIVGFQISSGEYQEIRLIFPVERLAKSSVSQLRAEIAEELNTFFDVGQPSKESKVHCRGL